MLYAVKIQEVLEHTVIVDADSFEEATLKTETAYYDEKIILDAEDVSERNFVESDTFGVDAIDPNDERLELFTYL